MFPEITASNTIESCLQTEYAQVIMPSYMNYFWQMYLNSSANNSLKACNLVVFLYNYLLTTQVLTTYLNAIISIKNELLFWQMYLISSANNSLKVRNFGCFLYNYLLTTHVLTILSNTIKYFNQQLSLPIDNCTKKNK